MHEQFSNDVQFIGVAGRDDIEAMEAFVDALAVGNFEHAVDESGVIWSEYGVITQPAFVFINDDGTVEANMGAMGEEGIIAAVQNLINT